MGESINLKPDSYSEGGGLIDDFDGTISDIRFVMTDYDGHSVDAVPVCAVKFTIDGDEVDPTLYSVGGKNDFAPNDSGMGLEKLKTKSTLTKSSKFGMLMASIVEAGFPLNKVDANDISCLRGLDAHFLRKSVEYKGLKTKTDRENTVLLCTKINGLPWENTKGGGGKAKAKGKGKAVEVDGSLADDLAIIIEGILMEDDGAMTKRKLLTVLFKDAEVKALSDRTAALQLAKDDKFLGGRKEWVLADGNLTIPE